MIDTLGIEYSLKKFIEDSTGIPSKIITTELENPKEFPYVYIRNVPSNYEVLSKGRETVEATYNFEIILYNNSKLEMNTNKQKIMRLLMFESFKYYTSNGEATKQYLEVDSGVFESPTFVDALENLSAYYQVSYDFRVITTHHKN